MIAALLMLAVAPLQGGQTQYPPLISVDDYPRRAMAKGEEGPVAYEALIAPDGHVDKCTILVSSHYSDLDDATCRMFQARARFSPAEDDRGAAIYGVYKNVIIWSLGNIVGGGLDPELELSINQAPAGVKLPLVMKVDYVTMPDGTATNCHLDPPAAASPPKPAPPPVLVDLACKSIVAGPPEVIRNAKGEPVEASDTTTVRFSVGR